MIIHPLKFTAIQCLPLSNISNGEFTYTIDADPNFALGTVAVFSCFAGYALVGNNIRTCMDDDQMDTVGVWSGYIPSCERKF